MLPPGEGIKTRAKKSGCAPQEPEAGLEPLFAELALVLRGGNLRLDFRPAAYQTGINLFGGLGDDGRGRQSGSLPAGVLFILWKSSIQNPFTQCAQPAMESAVVGGNAFYLLYRFAQSTGGMQICSTAFLDDRLTVSLARQKLHRQDSNPGPA